MPEFTTENDVVQDTIAALDMYAGTFGSESTVIDAVEEAESGSVVVTLSDGTRYQLRVRQL